MACCLSVVVVVVVVVVVAVVVVVGFIGSTSCEAVEGEDCSLLALVVGIG